MITYTEITSILGMGLIGYAIGRLVEYLLIGRKKVKKKGKEE